MLRFFSVKEEDCLKFECVADSTIFSIWKHVVSAIFTYLDVHF
jgi:hypothetical protein